MSNLKLHDRVVYCPLAWDGHYRAKVVNSRADESVDIDVIEEKAGLHREPLRLERIAVVPSLKDLQPGTCTKAIV